MGNQRSLSVPVAPGQSGLAAIKCTLTSRLRALNLYAAGMARAARSLWRKLSFTWDLDFSNLPIADYTLLPTPQSSRNTMNETNPCLLEDFYAWRSKGRTKKTPIFALEWENAWRWRSKDQMLMVLKRDKLQPDITEPSHSYYFLLTVRRIGKVIVVEVLYTDDKVTGWVIDRDVFSESDNLRRLALKARTEKFPAAKKITLRKLDKPATCAML